MYKTRHLNCSTSSVLSGIELFTMLRITIRRWHLLSSDRFAIFTYLCIKIPILPQHGSPPPRAIGMTLWISHPRIQCAQSLATLTSLAPSLLALSCMIMPHWSLPFPVPLCLPCLCLPHFVSSKASRIHNRSTTSNPLINHLSKVSAFLFPHQLRPPLAQYRTLSIQV
ncbi:hypothetical protein EDB92DRAFT_1877383 [Lactarius akahatsu]|uniref:Uncharacterized protein n=1 Tax=Lactarius akahatsu TaxID=416441 RepID=A0AAD4LAT4_9AGAM|nr:hypothetical protein EDB92DRAFT_1877383 [Lactarius akahatsu]